MHELETCANYKELIILISVAMKIIFHLVLNREFDLKLFTHIFHFNKYRKIRLLSVFDCKDSPVEVVTTTRVAGSICVGQAFV